MLTPAQCRAARGLLNWNQQQLAEAAGVGVATIRLFEAGKGEQRRSTLSVIRQAFEAARVEFTNGDQPGVRLAPDPTKELRSEHPAASAADPRAEGASAQPQRTSSMSAASTDGIYSQLCPPLPEEPDELSSLRRGIARAISSHLPNLEQLVGLEEPNSQFRDDLSEAILLCLFAHNFPPKRRSETRKQLEALSKEAAAAEAINRRLVSRLRATSGIYPPTKRRYLELFGNQTDHFAALATMARGHANSLVDRGGPRGMLGFRSLVELLLAAFEKATGAKASDAANYRGEEHGHEGVFFEFVDTVLPLVRELAPKMPCPESRLAQDTYVFKVVTAPQKRKAPKRRKRIRKVVIAGPN